MEEPHRFSRMTWRLRECPAPRREPQRGKRRRRLSGTDNADPRQAIGSAGRAGCGLIRDPGESRGTTHHLFDRGLLKGVSVSTPIGAGTTAFVSINRLAQ
jgi:hypothetical protein